jgi:hypothetical protein
LQTQLELSVRVGFTLRREHSLSSMRHPKSGAC